MFSSVSFGFALAYFPLLWSILFFWKIPVYVFSGSKEKSVVLLGGLAFCSICGLLEEVCHHGGRL